MIFFLKILKVASIIHIPVSLSTSVIFPKNMDTLLYNLTVVINFSKFNTDTIL